MGSDLMFMSESHDRARIGGLLKDHERMKEFIENVVKSKVARSVLQDHAQEILDDLEDIRPMDKNWKDKEDSY